MRLGGLVLSACLTHALCDGHCADSTWRENDATGKCYKIVPGYVGHADCAESCGAGASLACIQDANDDEFVYNWMLSEGIPGTPRKILWIGNYYTSAGGWAQCSNGQSSTYTNWTSHGGDEPVDGKPCAMFSLDTINGWISRDCLYWYHCLCESGRGTSTAYRAWHASHVDGWYAPWIAIGAWTFVVGAVVGLVPGLVGLLCRLRAKAEGDWNARVKSRVSFVMIHIGWLLLCLGFAPVIAFFVGFHAVFAIGYPQGYAALIPIGVTFFLLAIVPDNASSTKRALAFAVFFFSLFALVGLGAVFFYGVLSFWVLGLLMGAVFLIAGVGLAIVAGLAFCDQKLIVKPRLQLLRLWACMRLFFGVLFIVSIALLIEYTVNLSSQFSENIGWVFLALSSFLCCVLSRPKWRAKFCVWLSGVSYKSSDRLDALAAATQIFLVADDESSGGIQVPK